MKNLYTKIIGILFTLFLVSGFTLSSFASNDNKQEDSNSRRIENEREVENENERDHSSNDNKLEKDHKEKRLKKNDEDRINNIIDNFDIQKRKEFLLKVLERVAKLKENISSSNMTSERKANFLATLEEIRVIVQARYNELVPNPVPSTDTTPPVISVFQVSSIAGSGVTLNFTGSEVGVGYYVILGSGATTPTVTQVKDGQNSSGAVVAIKGNFTTSSGSNSKIINGLTPSTTYSIFFVMKDSSGNFSTSVYNTSFTTASGDITPPVLSGYFLSGITSTGAVLSATTNEAGKIYFVGAPSTFPAPSSTQIKAGQYASGSVASIAGNKDVVVGVNTVDIGSLSPNTVYVLYFTQDDIYGNLSAEVKSITFITAN